MERKLEQEPFFDLDSLRENVDKWKAHGAVRVVIEWSTGTGPTIFYYPAGERRFGVKWTAAVETTHYNEIYADFLAFTLIPRVTEAVQARGLEVTVICVDLQPLVVQRRRRHLIERAEAASAPH